MSISTVGLNQIKGALLGLMISKLKLKNLGNPGDEYLGFPYLTLVSMINGEAPERDYVEFYSRMLKESCAPFKEELRQHSWVRWHNDVKTAFLTGAALAGVKIVDYRPWDVGSKDLTQIAGEIEKIFNLIRYQETVAKFEELSRESDRLMAQMEKDAYVNSGAMLQ